MRRSLRKTIKQLCPDNVVLAVRRMSLKLRLVRIIQANRKWAELRTGGGV